MADTKANRPGETEAPLTTPKEPTFAPPVPDDGKAKGRGNEGDLLGRKGGSATGMPAVEEEMMPPDDVSRAPEEENHS